MKMDEAKGMSLKDARRQEETRRAKNGPVLHTSCLGRTKPMYISYTGEPSPSQKEPMLLDFQSRY